MIGQNGFSPIRVTQVELSEPLPDLPAVTESTGTRYSSARSLVRLHGRPLGILDLELVNEGLDRASYTSAIASALGPAVAAHLHEDGLTDQQPVPDGIVSADGVPACVASRRRFLERAPDVAVIIPTRERPDRLRACIDSIFESGYPSTRLEVLVVDNAPATSATLDLVRGHYGNDERVRYVREDNPGSASARNQGLTMVESDLVAFTDDDVVVDEHWLTKLAQGYDRHTEASCVNGLLLPYELETQAQVWFEQYGGFSRGFERRLYDLDENRVDAPLYPYAAGIYGTGNNMSFRREALREIGDFDPALGNGTPALGGVDSEVLLRTILRGHTIVYEPAALVWHLHRADYEGLKRQVYSYGVGLSAYMLKTLLAHPSFASDFFRRLPRGVRFALDPRSDKNENKQADYPRELTKLELRGMLYGPLAYVRSRRAFGSHRVRPPTVSARAPSD